MAHKDEIRTRGQAAEHCHCPVSIISKWLKRGWLEKKDGMFWREDLLDCISREFRLAEKFFEPQGHDVITKQKDAARYAGVTTRQIRRWKDAGMRIYYSKKALDRSKNRGTKQKPA